MLLAAALFMQVALHGPHAYTVSDPDTGALELSTQTGTYGLDLGWGCDGMTAGVNVEVLAGSGGVAALVPIGSDVLCNVYIDQQIDNIPCAVNADGVCDLDVPVVPSEVPND